MHSGAKKEERADLLKVTKNAFLCKPQYCFCDEQQHNALWLLTNDLRATPGCHILKFAYAPVVAGVLIFG